MRIHIIISYYPSVMRPYSFPIKALIVMGLLNLSVLMPMVDRSRKLRSKNMIQVMEEYRVSLIWMEIHSFFLIKGTVMMDLLRPLTLERLTKVHQRSSLQV